MKVVRLFDWRSLALLLPLLAGVSACGAHHVTRGANLYAEGHYIEAAEVFERTERRLEASSDDDRARYGLYRGATLLALGDTRRAAIWLQYSRELADAEAEILSDEEHRMLERALESVGRQGPAAPPTASVAAIAASETLPIGTVKNPRR